MKYAKKGILFFCMGAAVILLAAGCGKANTQSGGAAGQAPASVSGTMGIITEVSGNSITVAVMPQGNGAQGGGQGGQQPSGSGAPQQPQGSRQPPQGGQPGGAQQPQMDTSSWDKKTYKIDSGTKIVQDGSTGGTALKLSDLKTGESVVVAERSGVSGTAGQITVMQLGQGGPGGQGGPSGSAPAPQSTSKS